MLDIANGRAVEQSRARRRRRRDGVVRNIVPRRAQVDFQTVRACSAIDDHSRAGIAEQIVSGSAQQRIVVSGVGQQVVAVAAQQAVGPPMPQDGVVATAAVDRVVAGRPCQVVGQHRPRLNVIDGEADGLRRGQLRAIAVRDVIAQDHRTGEIGRRHNGVCSVVIIGNRTRARDQVRHAQCIAVRVGVTLQQLRLGHDIGVVRVSVGQRGVRAGRHRSGIGSVEHDDHRCIDRRIAVVQVHGKDFGARVAVMQRAKLCIVDGEIPADPPARTIAGRVVRYRRRQLPQGVGRRIDRHGVRFVSRYVVEQQKARGIVIDPTGHDAGDRGGDEGLLDEGVILPDAAILAQIGRGTGEAHPLAVEHEAV